MTGNSGMKRRPIFGPASLVIPLLGVLGIFRALNQGGERGLGTLILSVVAARATGLVLAFVGIARKERPAYFAFAGLFLSGVMVLLWLGLVMPR